MTGRGVITSLGAGKTDNWAKLTAGESGIRAITRFPTDGLRTRIAGTVDFLPPQSSTAALTERFAELAAEEAIAESGIGATGDFPGPLFIAVPPIEVEWTQRIEIAAKAGANDKVTYSDLLRASPNFAGLSRSLHDRFGRRPSGRQIRQQRFADLAIDRLRLGRDRHPARRRGDPARRDRCRAVRRQPTARSARKR